MNQIDVSHTIIAKSDQLNALDLPPAEMIVKITDVVVSKDQDQPLELHLKGHAGRPYKPCKSMRRILINAWGQYAEKWIGQSMALYCDPEVKWAGKAYGGIRIAKLTGIERTVSAPIALNRSMRELYTVDPLIISEPVLEPAIDWSVTSADFIKDINACASIGEMDAIKVELGKVWKSIPVDLAANITLAAEAKKKTLTA
jgi:hypothetical protein